MAVHLVFPACVVALSFFFVLCCPLELCLQASLQRQKSNWAQPNCPWASCYNIFQIATRQTTPGCFSTSSPLELAPFCLAPSQFFSWAHWSPLFTSCRYTRHFSMLSCLCPFSLALLLKDVFFACLLYPLAGSHPWLVLLPMPLAGEMQALRSCRPAWHHKSPALPPATLTLMQWAYTRDVLSLRLLCSLLALVSLSLWSLDLVLEGFRCLLAMDNTVFFMLFYFIKELVLELQCGPLSKSSIFA